METSMADPIGWRWTHRKRRFEPGHPFFEEGDIVCSYSLKQLPMEEEDETVSVRVSQFPCCIAGCQDIFDSIAKYESHYNSCHRHNCKVCKKTFPSNYLLEIHLLEWHDAMFDLMAAKQDMFQCLVEACEKKFRSPKDRKKHMVETHKYPANYRFDRVKKTQSEGKNDKSQVETERMETEIDPVQADNEKKSLNTETSSKRIFSYKVPENICFGQGSAKGFPRNRGKKKHKHWHQSARMDVDTTVNIENVNMTDLEHALGGDS